MVALLSPESIRAERARRSFTLFVKDAWLVIEPSTPFVDGWHLSAISEHLTAVSHGDIKRLLVNMPPRHCKSTLISTLWPVWSWLSNPSIRWLCASYALSLAIRDNRKCRLLIWSPWFQQRYGHIFAFAGDQKTKGRFETNKGGYRLAVSVGSAATGEGGDYLLIDDPHAIDESTSDVQRTSTLEWFDATWSSRLNNQETGAMVVVGQRIHAEDLSGHILDMGGWEHLNLPTEFEATNRCRTSLGWSDPRQDEGELLWPQRFNHTTLARMKTQLGSMAWAALMQQRPVPAGGGQFKKQWFRYFTETPDAYILETSTGTRSVLKSKCKKRFGVVDLAISSKQTADYTVIQIYDVTPQNDLLLLDQIRDRMDNSTQQRTIRLLHAQMKPNFFKVENVGYQLALIQQLKNEPKNLTDFIVEVANPEALDATLRQLPGAQAYVLRDDFTHKYVGNGINEYVVRVLGDVGFFKFAVEQQGYCKVVGQPGVEPGRISVPVKEYRPVKDKVSRATIASVLMEGEKIYFRKGAPYLQVLEPELLMFPLGAHDDQVDDLSMAADEVSMPGRVGGMVVDLNTDEYDEEGETPWQ